MRTAALLAALGSLLLSACVTAPVPTHAPQRAPSDGRLMRPEPAADHVWVMRQPDRLWAVVIGNVVIIEQRDGVVLIDSGGSIADGRDVVAEVAALTNKPIKAVAITHWHNDHPLGVPGILESFPNARIISTAVTRDYIRTETRVGIGKPDPEQDAKRRQRAEQVAADFAKEAARIDSVASLRAEYAIEAQWTLQRVERQMGAYAVLPTETMVERMLLDDARDRDYLRALEWSMTDIVNRATASAAAGLTKDDAFARFDQREQQSRFHAGDPWSKKWLNDYWLEGMFGTAYDEAKGIPAPGK
ncbi:MAG TPA: MBL fold metallo-hydrolase [Burkholderiaceae bacterium]